MAAASLPEGTVTFLFSDIEDSTELARIMGDGWRRAVEEHNWLIRGSVGKVGGIEVSTDGDSFFCVFTEAGAAVEAAVDIQRTFDSHHWPSDADLKVRIGLHTGTATRGGDNYLGLDLHVAARVAAAGHGGQLIISETTRTLVPSGTLDGVGWRDLGEHRLKGLDRPMRLHQAVIDGLPDSFPPLQTLTVPVHLPLQLTSFLGRERLVAEAAARLENGRLVTLTGPGGSGKTRVGIAVAGEAAPKFYDGVFFVDLAPITDSDLVASTILDALMAPKVSGPPTDRLQSYLGERKLLLVLDNFEQVLAAAVLVGDLLAAASGLKVLVTSRSPLRIQGEEEIPVQPLETPGHGPLPDVEEMKRVESVALFADRARAVRPEFALDSSNQHAVAEIVTSLDGLPLAIELAASRIRVLSAADIAARLSNRLDVLTGRTRDRPARQQTMRAAIEWSYELLPAVAQKLLSRLSVFVGGFDLDQAETVCGDDLDVLDGLDTLVEHSLVVRQEVDGQARFGLLATVKEYASETLRSTGELDTLGGQHAATYLKMAEEAAPHLLGPHQTRWLDRLERDHDNLRAALSWVTDHADSDAADRLVWAMWRMWQMRGHLDEGRRWADTVLALPETDPAARVRALEAAGGLAYWQGDLGKAVDVYQKALAKARQLGDGALVADALYNFAFGRAMGEGDGHAGQVALEEAEAIYRSLGDKAGEAKAVFGIATMIWEARTTEAYEEALPIYRKAAAMFSDLDDRYQFGYSLRLVARCLLELGRVDEARPPLDEAASLFVTAHDLSAVTILLTDYMMEATLTGDGERVVRLLGAMRAMRDTSGAGLVEFSSLEIPGLDDVIDGLGEGADALLTEGAAMSYEELTSYLTARQ